MNLENAVDNLTAIAVVYGPKLLGAILVLIICHVLNSSG